MSSNAEDNESQRPAQSEENETSHSSGKPTNAPSKEALEGPQSSAPTKKFEYERAPGDEPTSSGPGGGKKPTSDHKGHDKKEGNDKKDQSSGNNGHGHGGTFQHIRDKLHV